MPHFVIEYFPETEADFDASKAMQIALEAGSASGFIARQDIKLRAYRPEAILLADGRRSFAHVTISMLTGRTDDQKLSLAKTLVSALREAFPNIAAISVDTRDMNPECYKKSLDIRAP